MSETAALSATDRLDIAEAIGGLLLYLDRLDWVEAAKYLAPQVTTDYTEVTGAGLVTTTPQGLVDGWRVRFPGFDATMHQVTNIVITGAGDAAASRSNVWCTHRIDDRYWTFGAGYSHRLVRTAEGWRIAHLAIKLFFEQGDRDLRAEAAQRVADGRLRRPG